MSCAMQPVFCDCPVVVGSRTAPISTTCVIIRSWRRFCRWRTDKLFARHRASSLHFQTISLLTFPFIAANWYAVVLMWRACRSWSNLLTNCATSTAVGGFQTKGYSKSDYNYPEWLCIEEGCYWLRLVRTRPFAMWKEHHGWMYWHFHYS